MVRQVAGLALEDRQARYDALQQKLRTLWPVISRLNGTEQTIVVVPSISLDEDLYERVGPIISLYEERFLCLLLLLRQPRARLVFLSSEPVAEEVVGYYLSLLPDVSPAHARRRLFLLSPAAGSTGPLAARALADAGVLRAVKDLVLDPDRAHLVPFATTEWERDLALELGIPLYGSDPEHLWSFGGKRGGRRLFAEEGVPHPRGVELPPGGGLVDALGRFRAENPEVTTLLVKHDVGGGGYGNAAFDLTGLPAPGAPGERPALVERLRRFPAESNGWFDARGYLARLEAEGGVLEEFIRAAEVRSPSVQLRITPHGEVEVLSTHDQVLAGPAGQTYTGCVFPADPDYAADITASAEMIGRRLARDGVIGRFALDFVVTRTARGWDHFALEINLRKGGTTHPFLTLQFLTDGCYDAGLAEFLTPDGDSRCLVASDHVDVAAGTSPHELVKILAAHGLTFDHSRQTGVVPHMFGALSHGFVGLTAIAETRRDAEELLGRATRALGDWAPDACRPPLRGTLFQPGQEEP